ncbi:unnamed protein product [Rodentolepis nana]|uniref:Intimal thickness related receptor IRP domain-containing protein n=1 Tax=Rodentolepis nana TaxID=102285 RepID=A0A3P7SXZ8_RODNA|nr:unnamed protein product [Rodentolepis nana]
MAILCFALSYGLRSLRNSGFFPSRVRSLISDFAVLIAIVICSLIDYFTGLHTPKLLVPVSFEPTLGYNKRGWIIPPFNGNPWWTSLAAIGPALLAVILIFMDQQITSVIVNRRENKLKKGGGYHLDLLVVTITIAVNSVLGIPWFVAATVLSINHVISLKKESESSAPGECPIFLGCREQRVTGFFIFLSIGLSVFMSSVLRTSISGKLDWRKLRSLLASSVVSSSAKEEKKSVEKLRIPMAVLYGVFLLMGITSLNGLQIMERVGLFFTPAKYQPDYPYLRHVRLGRIHLFTAIQVLCLILLYVIKSVPQISILFPLMVLAMCFVRRGLDFVFSQEELYWLDDILPESSCSRRGETDTSGNQAKRFASATDFSSKDSLPLSQPLILNLDEKPFSVSEEVSKTLIWRQLSGIGLVNQDVDSKKKRRDRKKKAKRQRSNGRESGGSGTETSDSRRGSLSGHRFRALRLFSSDFDGAIGRDIAVLFHSNETDQAMAGILSLNAYWNAPEIWNVAYTSKMTCEEKLTILQNFSPNQKFQLSAEDSAWCEYVDLRNYAHPFELPDFQEAEGGMVEPIVEIASRYQNHSRYDYPRLLYTFPLESHHSSILQSAFYFYRYNPDISPNWIYCKSPKITFTPGKISWFFFALDSCKEVLKGKSNENPIPVFYRLEMQNGKGDGNLFRRHFSLDDFGSLETVLIFWVASIASLFIGGWIAIMNKDKKHLRYPLLLFLCVLLFSFIKHLFALMCLGHLSNVGRRPLWLEIINDLMGGATNCALVALLLLLASGYCVVHKDPGNRMKIVVLATVAVYGPVQLICGVTVTLAFDSGQAKYVYQSPSGYTLVTLNIATWLVFLLIAMYTNTHWPTKRLFYLTIICFYSVWFWTLPIVLIINGDYIALWRRLGLHRSITSIADLAAQVFLLYIFWPSSIAKIFIRSDEDQYSEEASLTPVPRTSITPVTVPKLSIDSRSPRKKSSKTEGPTTSTSNSAAPKSTFETPRTPEGDEQPTKDMKSKFLKKLIQ